MNYAKMYKLTYVFFIALFVSGIMFFVKPQDAFACYPICDMSVCVNGVCPAFPTAYHGDTVSLLHVSGLADATAFDLGGVSISDWTTDGEYMVRFVIPDNVPADPNGKWTSVKAYKGGFLVGSDVLYMYSGEKCEADVWSCEEWGTCTILGVKTRGCTMTFNCPSATSTSPTTRKSCAYNPGCSQDVWECGDWSTCSSGGSQDRTCTKTFDCPTVDDSKPVTSQSCAYQPPPCQEDIWTCEGWSTCESPGQQRRDCRKTFDCSYAETAPPATTQNCDFLVSPSTQNQPPQTNESPVEIENERVNLSVDQTSEDEPIVVEASDPVSDTSLEDASTNEEPANQKRSAARRFLNWIADVLSALASMLR